MKKLFRLLIKILIITLITAGGNALIGLIFRWRTAVQFSDSLFWSAVVLAGLGILSALGVKEIRLISRSKPYRSSPQERQIRLEGEEDPPNKWNDRGTWSTRGLIPIYCFSSAQPCSS